MKSQIRSMFELGAKIALPRTREDFSKKYWLGCVGIRTDGTLVSAKNLYARGISKDVHAEGRTLKMMDKGGVLYVTRIAKSSTPSETDFAMARPCHLCEFSICSKKIRKVYYTINNCQFGIWIPESDKDTIHRF